MCSLCVVACGAGAAPPAASIDAGEAIEVDGPVSSPDARAVPDAHSAADAPVAPDAPVTPDAHFVVTDAHQPDVRATPDARPLADARPPPDAGPCGVYTRTASRVDLSDIFIDEDGNRDFVLPDSFGVSGVISAASIPEGAVVTGASMVAIPVDTSASRVYPAQLRRNGDVFTYSIGLPAARFALLGSINFAFGPGGSEGTIEHFRTQVVTVCGDQIFDLTVPDFSELELMTTTVDLSQLGAAVDPAGYTLQLDSIEAFAGILAIAPPVHGNTVSYMYPRLDGYDFIPMYGIADAGSGTTAASWTILQGHEESANSPLSLTPPPSDFLYGHVDDPRGQLSPTVPSLIHNVLETPLQLSLGGVTEANVALVGPQTLDFRVWGSGGYREGAWGELAIVVGPGGSPTTAGENTYGYLESPRREEVGYAVFYGQQSYGHDFTVLDASGQAQLAGTVRDARGNPIAGATLTARSPELTPAVLFDAAFHAEVVTDADGKFRLNVVQGIYDVTITR